MMITLIALGFAAFLQLAAAVIALLLLKVAKGKISWLMISIAFIFVAVRRVFEVIAILKGEYPVEHFYTYHWLGIFVSVIMALSVLLIGKILFSFNNSENARIESESRFQTLFNHSSDEIYLADPKGNLIEVNQVACDTLGYTREEFLHMNFRDLKTNKYYNTVEPNLKKILENGKHIYETEHVSKEGHVISLEVKSRLIDYQGQKAVISIARETTERKQMERRILSAVINAEENERERISKEIHDGLGPLLSTVKLYVNELESDDLSPEEKSEMLKQTNDLIDESISSTRSISNNLTPRLIIDFGLVKAVESFCKKINLTQKLQIIFENQDVEGRLDHTVELILYRIITELINNTLKHASAKRVEISLIKQEENLKLTYMDDGIGFDKEEALAADSSGMGMKNMISRIRSINGNYHIHSQDGQGILVIIDLNLKNPLATVTKHQDTGIS